ncbi:MAG: hypothetical protein HY763_08915 [Planctomycetes bacterium]|nr:hypothetical protein [Planctomycetota bacterium]
MYGSCGLSDLRRCVTFVSSAEPRARRGPALGVLLGVLGLMVLSPAPTPASAFTLVDFTVDPGHAGPPHTVFYPDFDNFELCITGTFDTSKCYTVKIERSGGSDCGSANDSGTDSILPGVDSDFPGVFCNVLDVSATSIRADISPNAAASFKRGTDWQIEVRERSASCSGSATLMVHPILLTIAGCNDTCLLNGTTLVANPNPTACDGVTQLCATAGGSGNLRFDWDTDGDGACDDATTYSPTNCLDVALPATTTVKVCVTDLGTNVPCTSSATTTVTVGASNCNDNNPCTDDVCVTGTGCVYTPDDTNLCSDGVFCNGAEVCSGGACQAGTDPCPPDAVDCTVDSCDETNDVCLHTPVDGFCDNGLFCDGVEVCHPTNGCQDGPDPCPAPTKCSEELDQCVACLSDNQCNDNLFCNGVETCVNNVCVPGDPPECGDAFECTIDGCDNVLGCTHTPDHAVCNDDNICTDDACVVGAGCQHTNNTLPCDDGNLCTINDQCAGGACVGTPKDCSHLDGPCTRGKCAPATGICIAEHINEGGPCSDGLYCTDPDTCQSGVCTGPPRDCGDEVTCTNDSCDEANDVCLHFANDAKCDDTVFCNGAETCDPILGCRPGTPPCSDTVDCTIVTCDEAGDFCVITPDDAFCSDGLFCNGQEFCDIDLGCQPGVPPCAPDSVDCTLDSCDEVADVCLHTPVDSACDDGAFCDGAEVCDPLLGCVEGTPPCQAPLQCDEVTNQCVDCLSDAKCDDGLYCNGIETCVSGTCQPGTPPCPDDGVPCTVDTCVEGPGGATCLHTPDHEFCSNGLFCDGMELCDAQLGCVDGPDPCVPDGDLCTYDVCDELTDTCQHPPVICPSDGMFCNGTEQCDPGSGACVSSGDPCPADGIPCTDDLCNEQTDTCEHVPVDGRCDDGVFCNGSEVCDVNVGCVDQADPCLPDEVLCTNDFCNEDKDRCEHVPDDAVCDDTMYCNGAEKCDPVNPASDPVTGCRDDVDPCIPDEIACTKDSCDEATDACLHTPDDMNCTNGLFCDGVERCDPGAPGADPLTGCRDDADPCAPDAVACTDDVCNEGTDACEHIPNHSLCDDGDECTDDVCTGAACENNNNGLCGACCLPNKACQGNLLQASCEAQGGSFVGAGTSCGQDADGDGNDDHCDNCPGVDDAVFGGKTCCKTGVPCGDDSDCDAGIEGNVCKPACQCTDVPTVSQWGLLVLTLLLLAAGKVYFGYRRVPA